MTQVALGFLTTLVVTISGEVNTSTAASEEGEASNVTDVSLVTSNFQQDGGQSATATAAAVFEGMSNAQRGFYLVAIILPALMSIISSLRQDLNYAPKIIALRYAAAEVLSETYRYRARAGVYGDLALAKDSGRDDTAAGEDRDERDDRKVDWGCDTISARAEILTSKLVDVSARLDSFDRPNFDDDGWLSWLMSICYHFCCFPCITCVKWYYRIYPNGVKFPWQWACCKYCTCRCWKKGSVHDESSASTSDTIKVAGLMRDENGVKALAKKLNFKRTANSTLVTLLTECKSERQYGLLSGDDYVKKRLKPEMQRCEDAADIMERCYMAYRMAAYVLGALGSILSLLRFEVRNFDLLHCGSNFVFDWS
jgi:hypothetical protein